MQTLPTPSACWEANPPFPVHAWKPTPAPVNKQTGVKHYLRKLHFLAVRQNDTMNVERNEESSTCSIFTAAAKGNVERIRIMLNQGSSVNSVDETQATPLMLALENVRGDCVKYRLDSGADVKGYEGVDLKGDEGANVKGDEGVDVKGDGGVDVNGDIGADVNEGRHVECISLLLEHGANVNQTGKYNESPLMAATISGNTWCISLLLRKGADVNQKDKNGITALFFASDINIVKILLSEGADVNHKNYLGETALFHAEDENIVNALVAAGANVNEKDDWGQTALFDAGNEKVVQALLEAGAGVNSKNNQGETALFHVSNEKIVQTLLAAGADVNSKNNQGETALFHISNVRVVKTFVVAGANVDEKGINNRTALFGALERGRMEVVTALLQAGADVNHRDNNCNTALIYAVYWILHSWEIREMTVLLKCVKALLRAGFKINRTDYKVKTDIKVTDEVADLLFAAGEEDTKYSSSLKYLPPEKEINLKHKCTKVIRNHLLHLDTHTHLFGRVPRLGLPKTLQPYILYNQTLDDDDVRE